MLLHVLSLPLPNGLSLFAADLHETEQLLRLSANIQQTVILPFFAFFQIECNRV